MIHIRLVVSKTHGVKLVLLCDKSVVSYDKHKWYITKYGKNFYVERKNGKNNIKLHREILGLESGNVLVGDHWNGNGLDNQFSNLRICPKGDNVRNARKSSNNTSGFKGVFWDKQDKKWRSKIDYDGKTHNLGRFNTPEEAHEAYCKKGKELHGEFFNAG